MKIEDIERMVCLQLGLKKVAPGDRLVEDLGAESVDVVNLISAIEDRFDIDIDEDEIDRISTVSDLFDRVRSQVS